MRSDVAASAPGPGGGSSPGSVDTLRPTPTTIASPAASARIPPSFAAPAPAPASTSFGHFSRVATPVSAVTAEATATPASSGSQPRRVGGTAAGRTSRENVSAARGGDTQVRPIRPRPAFCSSATSTTPSGAPARARASRSALVEPVRSSTSTACHRPPGRSTARRRPATSRGFRPAAAPGTTSAPGTSSALSRLLGDHLSAQGRAGVRGHLAAMGQPALAYDFRLAW